MLLNLLKVELLILISVLNINIVVGKQLFYLATCTHPDNNLIGSRRLAFCLRFELSKPYDLLCDLLSLSTRSGIIITNERLTRCHNS